MKFNHELEKDGEDGPSTPGKFSNFVIELSDASKYKTEKDDYPMKDKLKLEAFAVHKKADNKNPDPLSAVVIGESVDFSCFTKADPKGTFTIPLKDEASYKALNKAMKTPTYVFFKMSGLPLKKDG